jgi:hypothetical protein
MSKSTKKPQWGGARKNAGRPATGRKPRKGITLYLNDDEKNKLDAVIIATGKTQTGVFRDAIKKEFEDLGINANRLVIREERCIEQTTSVGRKREGRSRGHGIAKPLRLHGSSG